MIRSLLFAAKRFFKTVRLALLCTGAYVAIVVSVGPYLQQRIYPVIQDFRVFSTKLDDQGRMIFWGQMTKNYACAYKGFSWFYMQPNGDTERALIEFLDYPDGEPYNQGVGMQSFGPWRITLPKQAKGGRHYGLVYHKCLNLWLTHSVVGPLPDWTHDPSVEVIPSDPRSSEKTNEQGNP